MKQSKKSAKERIAENLNEAVRLFAETDGFGDSVYSISVGQYDVSFQGHFSKELKEKFEQLLNAKATVNNYVEIQNGIFKVTLT